MSCTPEGTTLKTAPCFVQKAFLLKFALAAPAIAEIQTSNMMKTMN